MFIFTTTAYAEEKAENLTAKARDPTAPLTACTMRYGVVTSFHNLNDADQQQLTLQPIIP